MIRQVCVCGVLLLFMLLVSGGDGGFSQGTIPTAQEEVLYSEDFEDGQAQGWTTESGWDVIQDSQGNWVFHGQGHRWARYAPGGWGDYTLRLRLKLLQGGIHVNFRLGGLTRYFIGFTENGLYLNKTVAPDTHPTLRSTEARHQRGRWYQVEIRGRGGKLDIYVDGALKISYTDPDPLLFGTIALETLDDSEFHVNDVQVLGRIVQSDLQWVRTGGPLGGLGYDIRMRPDNVDTLYVTDAYSGVNMSTDGGRTWFPSNEGITTRTGASGDAIPVFCLTIDPHNPNIIWVGTQNTRGIFKSTDGGRTWIERDNGVVEREGITFRGFTVHPQDSNIVYAAGEVSSFVWAGQPRDGREFDMTQGVVYKTLDGGQNWQPVWRGDNLARYVWIDPRDPNVVFVSTGIFDREAANSVPATRTPGGVGIIKSTDGGKTWTPVNQGLENLYVGSLFMHPDQSDILLAGAGNVQYYSESGVYLSTNGGASWQHVLQDDNIESVEFALSDPDIAYAGSSDAVYRSRDGGRTWQRVSGGPNGWGPPGVRAGFPIDFQVDPRNPDRLFANNYGGGNFVSADGGRSWIIASQGYTGAQVRDVAIDPSDASKVFAAARSGLFSSNDRGQSWIGLSYPPVASLEWYVVAVDPHAPQHLLSANNWNGVLLQSSDGGRNWRVVSDNPGRQMGFRAIAFAPSNPRIIYAGTSAYFSAGTFSQNMAAAGVYLSRDGGATWGAANDVRSRQANVTALAVDARDPNRVFAATGNLGILKSSDGGGTWASMNQGLPSSPTVLSVALRPDQPEVVFIGLERGGVYKSTDGGQTWRASGRGMNPEATVSDVVFDPVNPQVIYAADRQSGVFRSADEGATWVAINSGLRTRDVNSLTISPDGATIYAGTEGEGVFRLDVPEQASDTSRGTEQPGDRDGDGVPDSADYCPDYGGDPAKSGC